MYNLVFGIKRNQPLVFLTKEGLKHTWTTQLALRVLFDALEIGSNFLFDKS